MRYAKYVIIGLFVCGVLAVIVLMFGAVTGEEFSPQKFARRRFDYWQIPILRKQITPVDFDKSWSNGSELTDYLKSMKLLGDVTSEEIRWDIVHISEIGASGSRGDAEILTKYFEQWGAVGGSTWLEWTQDKKNSAVAATLWPLVAKLAHEKLYFLIPDLFDAARGVSTPEEFLDIVRPKLLESLSRMAKIEGEQNDVESEKQLQNVAEYVEQLQAQPLPAKYVKDVDENEAEKKKSSSNSASEVEVDEGVAAEADPEDIE